MYSQKDEEKYILEACKNAQRKRVLDIGAFHPTTFSNSRALIDAGWYAVLIEPSPGPLRNLVMEYGFQPNITVISAAVGLEPPGYMELIVTDDGVSTNEVKEVWRDVGGYYGKLVVPCMTIRNIVDRYGAFDCVSIDTEGTSVDVCKDLLATEMLPQCICVEHDNRIVEMLKAARARGYHPVYENEENLVFSL